MKSLAHPRSTRHLRQGRNGLCWLTQANHKPVLYFGTWYGGRPIYDLPVAPVPRHALAVRYASYHWRPGRHPAAYDPRRKPWTHYLYTIECCQRSIDIYAYHPTICPWCGTVFYTHS